MLRSPLGSEIATVPPVHFLHDRVFRYVLRALIIGFAIVGAALCMSLLDAGPSSAATVPAAPLAGASPVIGGTPTVPLPPVPPAVSNATSVPAMAAQVIAPAIAATAAVVPAPVAMPIEQAIGAATTVVQPAVTDVAADVLPVPDAAAVPPDAMLLPASPGPYPRSRAPAPRDAVRASFVPAFAEGPMPVPSHLAGQFPIGPAPLSPLAPNGSQPPGAASATTGMPLLGDCLSTVEPARGGWSGPVSVADVTPSCYLAFSPVDRPG